MIVFEKIRYKNFLSTGNNFTEIHLNKSQTTLIVGGNGNGKTTILDALCFVLYGKPLRNINKPQLINSITQRDLVVEIELSANNKKYLIRRGMRPGFFEIFCDGKLIDQEASALDYQTIIEKQILKMNFKSFKQIVILGSTSYVPFMQLRSHERREVIEDLLDIGVFSKMNIRLKERISANRERIRDVDHLIDVLVQRIEMHKKHITSMKETNDGLIKKKKDEIESLVSENESFTSQLNEYKLQIDTYSGMISDKTSHQAEIDKNLNRRDSLQSLLGKIEKDDKFYDSNDVCPTCGQNIDDAHKTSVHEKNAKKIERIKAELTDIDRQYQDLLQRSSVIEEIEGKIKALNESCDNLSLSIRSNEKLIKSIEREIVTLSKKESFGDIDDLKKSRARLEKCNKEKENLLNEKEILDVATVLLKDGGIKTRIVKQFIPIINKLINKYMAKLDFPIEFTLDEHFSEKIRSRNRDEFTYESFSEGEKARLDIAMLFTWRAVAKMRNSTSTNLLIFDEVFDGSLDFNGSDGLIELINDIEPNNNVFVISHKAGDLLYDKFHSVIEFEKVKNFSRIKTQ